MHQDLWDNRPAQAQALQNVQTIENNLNAFQNNSANAQYIEKVNKDGTLTFKPKAPKDVLEVYESMIKQLTDNNKILNGSDFDLGKTRV